MEDRRHEAPERRWEGLRPPSFRGLGLCPRKMFEILHENLYILMLFGIVGQLLNCVGLNFGGAKKILSPQ